MNIIVPLSNENYYKLYFDNIHITNDLVLKTAEIIGFDKNNLEKIKNIHLMSLIFC